MNSIEKVPFVPPLPSKEALLEDSRAGLEALSLKASQYGVWCKEDRGGHGAWCDGTIGTWEHANERLPLWKSGVGADVDPSHFTYLVAHMFTDEDVQRELREALRVHVPRVLERLAQLEALVEAATGYRFSGEAGSFVVCEDRNAWRVAKLSSSESEDTVAVNLSLDEAMAEARRLAKAEAP